LTTAADAGEDILRFDRCLAVAVNREVDNVPKRKRCAMPEFQPVSSAHISAIERPRCPTCQQNRMLLSKIEAGSSGFGHRTFECQKCGRVETTIVSSDPMTSDTIRWLASELRPPT
jgi:DNA-directed RNA polymerase subunit M/transcription elongation factor TFIIS